MFKVQAALHAVMARRRLANRFGDYPAFINRWKRALFAGKRGARLNAVDAHKRIQLPRKPPSFAGNRLHLVANFRIIWRFVAPDDLGIDTNKPARPTLRDVVIPHRLACRSPSHIRCRQFFPSKSFNTTLSSIVSARRRFCFAFSSSRDLGRWVSETFIPPYLA